MIRYNKLMQYYFSIEKLSNFEKYLNLLSAGMAHSRSSLILHNLSPSTPVK